MLKDRREIEIMSRARQKNVADPKRSREHFERIFDDFLSNVVFEGTRVLDLGPGQYDFAELANARGAVTEGIDKDEAVVELGEYRGLPVRRGDLKNLRAADFEGKFDGIFCKFSINAFWLGDEEEAQLAYAEEVDALLAPDGWGWIAPWNGVPKREPVDADRVRRTLIHQATAFHKIGFVGFDLSEPLSKLYGVHGATANRALFLRNVEVPAAVRACEIL